MKLNSKKNSGNSNDFVNYEKSKINRDYKKEGVVSTPSRKTGRFNTTVNPDKLKAKTQSKGSRILKKIGIIASLTFLFSILIGILFLIGLVSVYSKGLPNLDQAVATNAAAGQESVIVDRNGKELYRLQGNLIKEKVELKDIPDKLQWAFMSAEDAEFKSHKGLNLLGLSRAVVCAIRHRGEAACGGGSSITQQTIKNTTPLKDRSIERKIKEAVLAMKLEQTYSKDQILEIYMNVVPEGGRLAGVKTGASYHFGKDNLNDLSLAEMAFLAAVPNEPSVLSPYGGTSYDADQSRARTIYVLNRMLELKDRTGVTKEEVEKAKEEVPKLSFKNKDSNMLAPNYVNYVITELNNMYKDKAEERETGSDYVRGKGYTIVAAVDYDTQKSLEDHLKAGVEAKNFQSVVGAHNAAAVMMDPTNGEVLAMVGSKDFYGEKSKDGKFDPETNVATAPRSMGSTNKVVTYLNTFINNGDNPSTPVPDIELDMRAGPNDPPYIPQNYNRKYSVMAGEFPSMREALRRSLNMPAVSSFYLGGGASAYEDTYIKLNGWEGIRDQVQGASATLGAANIPLLEQVHAYSTIANMGSYHDKKVILEIKDNTGKVVFDNKKVESKQVIDKRYAYMINDMNKNYITFTTDNLLKSIEQTTDIAGKTGTSDAASGKPGDVVFMAYTPGMVLGMWAGNNCGVNQCPLEGSEPTGEGLYYNLYKDFLTKYKPKIKAGDRFQVPSGLSKKSVCRVTGREYSADTCPSEAVNEWVADNPKKEDMVKVVDVVDCAGTIKLASQSDIDAGLSQKKKYFIYKYTPAASAGTFIASNVQRQINDRYKANLPPAEKCDIDRSTVTTGPQINIVSPVPNSEFTKNETLSILVAKTSDIKLDKVEIFIDDKLVDTEKDEPYTSTVSLKDYAIKEYTINVEATSVDGQKFSAQRTFKVVDKKATPTPSPSPTQTLIITIKPTVKGIGGIGNNPTPTNTPTPTIKPTSTPLKVFTVTPTPTLSPAPSIKISG